VLDSMHPQSSVLGDWHLMAPWGLDVCTASGSPLHFVVEGECWVRDSAGELVHLGPEDLIMFPHWERHALLSAPEAVAIDIRVILERSGTRPWVPGERAEAPIALTVQGNGPATRIISSVVHFERPGDNPLLRELPRYIHLKAEQTRAAPLLRSILQYITAEIAVTQPGYATIAIRLSELLFIQVIRSHLLLHLSKTTGWLRSFTDAHLSNALRALHRNVDHHWTVDALAREAGLSRSAFAKRFKDLTGVTPMDYVCEWRMHVAANALVSSRALIADVARKVGYGTTFSFSEAFKRCYAVSPGQYRKRHRRSGPPS